MKCGSLPRILARLIFDCDLPIDFDQVLRQRPYKGMTPLTAVRRDNSIVRMSFIAFDAFTVLDLRC
ncbi:hypothetical protein WK62_19715 [Burkholderia ubonensis]|nr:hypothetical protein WK62_19715 [Burkholderia ubonensis]